MSQTTPIVVLPTLPLKNSVLFPRLLMPLSVGRPASVAAVEAALASEDKTLGGLRAEGPVRRAAHRRTICTASARWR